MKKIQKLLGHKILRCTNTTVSLREKWRQNLSPVIICINKTLLQTRATCVTLDGLQNNPYICLELWEKKSQTYNHGLGEKQSWKTEFHKLRQMPICQATIKSWVGTALQGSIDVSYRDLMNNTFHTWILDKLAWL